MKRIIEIEESLYNTIMCTPHSPVLGWHEIAQSVPYNPSEDCISRSDLKDKMKKAEEQADTFEMLVEFYEQIIDNAQAVEPERPQGKWEIITFPHSLNKYKCNQCQHYLYSGMDRNFCPNCGADMRKGAAQDE